MTRLRRVLLLLALLGLVAGCNPSITPPATRQGDVSLIAQAQLATCPTVGAPVKGGLPHVTLSCLGNGPKVDLAGLRGPAIVNVWYSACPPCQAEAGYLARFQAADHGKVLMVGVDSEAYPDPGLNWVASNNLHFAQLTDQHSDLSSKVPVRTFPSTYFLDAAGHLVGQPLSPVTSLRQLEDAVRTRLGVTVS